MWEEIPADGPSVVDANRRGMMRPRRQALLGRGLSLVGGIIWKFPKIVGFPKMDGL